MIDRILARVRELYGLAWAEAAEVLRGGEWNDVLRLDTSRGPLVLRIAPPGTDFSAVQYVHDTMLALADAVPEVVPPLVAGDGRTASLVEGRTVAVFPFIQGCPQNDLDEVALQSAGAMLARVHRAGLALGPPHPSFTPLRNLDWDRNHRWDGRAIRAWLGAGASEPDPDGLSGFLRLLGREGIDLQQSLESARVWINELQARPLTVGVVHGDYYPDNVLSAGGRITGVIDWDDARPEWLVYELARATWEFCRRGRALPSAAARGFVDAYRDAGGPVPAVEDDLLIPFVCWTRLEDTLFDLTQALRIGGWTAEHSAYHLENLQAMRDLGQDALLNLGS